MTTEEEKLIQYLGQVSSQLSSINNLSTLIEEVSQIIEKLIHVEYTAIYLWDDSAGKLVLHSAKGFSEEDIINAEQSAMKRHPGWVFQNKQLFHIEDTLVNDSDGISKTGKRSFEVRSRLFIPVLNMDKSIGTIGFASHRPKAFTKKHITVLSFIANITGAVYSNIIFKTAEKKYQQQLEDALAETQQAKEYQQSFFAKMSHELRTPLNAIIGMENLLTKTNLDYEQQKYIRAVSISSASLLNIINDILDLSKLQSDQYSLEGIDFNIFDVVEKTQHSLRFKAQEKGIKLKYNNDDSIVRCVGDPLRLGQVLVNLANNAIKFTDKGEVLIGTELVKDYENHQKIRFYVKDTGKGIRPDKLETIFDSFKQEDNGITRAYGGTGLGLTIAREIVNQYGSAIHVESELGKGSEFSFKIKLRKGNGIENSNSSERAEQFDVSDLRVLLVEDNEINLLYARTILEKENILVDVAKNGQIAVDKSRQHTYDLVLMDMQMPVMNGIEATRIIRNELNSNVPIIGVSANTVEEDIESCYAAGMNAYIAKPFVPEELFPVIGKILKLNRLRHLDDVEGDRKSHCILLGISKV